MSRELTYSLSTSSQIPYCRRYLVDNYTAYDCGSLPGVTYTLDDSPTSAPPIGVTSSAQSPLPSSSISSYSSPSVTGSTQMASSSPPTASPSSISVAFTESQVANSGGGGGSGTPETQGPGQSSASPGAPTTTASGNLARPKGLQSTRSLRLWCGLVFLLAIMI